MKAVDGREQDFLQIAKKIWDERDHEGILSITLEMPENILNKDSELLVWDGLGARKEEGD